MDTIKNNVIPHSENTMFKSPVSYFFTELELHSFQVGIFSLDRQFVKTVDGEIKTIGECSL